MFRVPILTSCTEKKEGGGGGGGGVMNTCRNAPTTKTPPLFPKINLHLTKTSLCILFNFRDSNVFKYIPTIHCCPPQIKLTATI